MVDGGGRWESGREGKKGGREERKAGHTYITMVSLWYIQQLLVGVA